MERTNICSFDETSTFSRLGIQNLNGFSAGAFGAGSVADELDDLADALANDEEIYVDEEGVLHRANDVEGLNTLSTGTSNMIKVNRDPFAGKNGTTFTERTASENRINNLRFPQTLPEQDPSDSAGEILMLDDFALTMELDDEGFIQSTGDTMDTSMDEEPHRANDVESLNTLSTGASNIIKVNRDPFAGKNGNIFTERTASENEINNLRFPQTLPEQNLSDSAVFVQPETAESKGETMVLDDSALTMELDDEGFIQSTGDTMDTSTDGEQETEVSGRNMTRISSKPFAAASIRKPTNPDQWYNKNPLLFKAEVANMRRHHPNAKMGFLGATGNMYWLIETKIANGVKPWHFVLEYEKDHPNNHSYGGSIHVQLLKSPSLEELRTRARANGRMGVPHVVSATRANGESYTYLCTRRPDDVNTGERLITSAVQVAGWAADWALHFETGLRSKEVWNKWCNDSHFRHLMIP